MGRRVSGLGTEELLFYSGQMTWFCWLPLAMTSSTPWGGLRSCVKWLGCASAPLSQRPWFSAIKVNGKMKLEITSLDNIRYSD